MPLLPSNLPSGFTWTMQVLALGLMGVGSALGTITTLPDMKHVAGPGTTDIVASIFSNVCVPAGEVVGPLIGGGLTELLGFRWASFSLGLALGAYAVCLVVMDMSGTMPWTHHRDPRHKLSLVHFSSYSSTPPSPSFSSSTSNSLLVAPPPHPAPSPSSFLLAPSSSHSPPLTCSYSSFPATPEESRRGEGGRAGGEGGRGHYQQQRQQEELSPPSYGRKMTETDE
ncbi:hypothetical protein VYU27_007423 [Nannochloropsis oceanica]